MNSDLACWQGCCLSATLWKGHNALTGVHPHPTPQPSLPPIIAAPRPAPAPAPAPIAPPMPAPAPEPFVAPVPVEAMAGACAEHASDALERGLPMECPSPDHCPVVHPGKSERERLIEALDKTGWVQAKAARLLGLTPRQIGYALRKQNIDIKKFWNFWRRAKWRAACYVGSYCDIARAGIGKYRRDGSGGRLDRPPFLLPGLSA